MNVKHLAVDLGSSNAKCMLMELTADYRAIFKEAGRFKTPKVFYGGHICTDIYRIFAEIGDILQKIGARGTAIESIGVDSWSSDFGIVASSGEIVGLPVFYRDARTNGMPEEVEKVISYRALYSLSTQRRMRDSTLCQLVAQKKAAGALLENGNKILFLADAVMQFFTGRIVSEMTLASYSQLFNMEKMCWEDRVFALFGIPKTIQPDVVNPGEYLGGISRKMGDWYGINRFSAIAPAAHDTASAVCAVPAREGENWAFISTGSWFLVGMELDAPQNLELCYRYNFSNTGLAFQKTMLKRNVTAMWIFQECVRAWSAMGLTPDYAQIDARAAAAKPFYAFIDTDAADFYNPDNMLEAIVRYLARTNQPLVEKDDIGQIARMINEAIALKCRYAISCLEAISGRAIDTVYVVGGASAVDILNRMLASACAKRVVTGPKEAAGAGNCLLQAYGCGKVSSQAEIREIIRRSFPEKVYFPEDAAQWDAPYEKFRAICGMEI